MILCTPLRKNVNKMEILLIFYGRFPFLSLPGNGFIMENMNYSHCIYDSFPIVIFCTLKNKTENNSFWEGAFYQSKWVKIDSSWVFLFFHFLCVAVNASKLFRMAQQILRAFYTILTFHFKHQILYSSSDCELDLMKIN